MRLIDADALVEVAIRHADLGGPAVVYPADIGAAPSIRCGDCEKWSDEPPSWNTAARRCTDLGCYLTADCGCSFFARRDP